MKKRKRPKPHTREVQGIPQREPLYLPYQTTCWDLIIHWYPRAILNDVKPIIVINWGQLCQEKNNPSYYRPHTMHFANPPTMEEFLHVCGLMPWTSVWDTDLLPLIRKSKWPKIPAGFKRDTIELKKDKRQVGELTIEKITIWKNEGASIQ